MPELLNDKIARLMWEAGVGEKGMKGLKGLPWDEIKHLPAPKRMCEMALRILKALGIRPAGEGGFCKPCPLCEDVFRVTLEELGHLDAPAKGR